MNSKINEAKRISLDLPLIGDSKSTSHAVMGSTSNFRYEIVVDLFEPDMKTFPEFNYKKLLHVEKKKYKKREKFVNGTSDDPFEDNDDDVERIAKEFERKYGGSTGGYSSGNKKIKRANLDYCDKGVGYDDNDSFIDNTEAYDEIIPEEIETVNGGFYINSGSLEFKNISNFERPEDAIRMPKPKKRVISSSSSSSSDSSEDEDDDKEEKMETNDLDNGVISKNKNGHPSKKQKVTVTTNEPPPIVVEKPKVVPKDKPPIEIKKVKKDKKEDPPQIVVESNNLNKLKPIKTTTVKDMLRAKRDNCLLMKEGAVKSDTPSNNDKDLNDMDAESTSSSYTSLSSHDRPKTPGATSDISSTNNNLIDDNKNREIKLPANLPENLLKNINLMKEAGLNANSAGKINFFDTRINELLLKIDNEARTCGSTSRNQLYSYLEYFLPCTKQTLLARSKKLRFKQEENKLTKTLSSLKNEIQELWPGVLKSYTEESGKITYLRSKMTLDEKLNSLPKMPRRRFPWTEPIQSLFLEVYKIKSSFYSSGKNEETLEEYMEAFYKSEVVKIWPEGWMKVEELKREINRRLTGDKKPKENKKPGDVVTITLDNDLQSTTAASTITQSGSGTVGPIKDSSKNILSSNNIVSKSIEKNTNAQSSNSNKIENTSNNTSSVIPSPLNFGSNLTITAVKTSPSSNSNSKTQTSTHNSSNISSSSSISSKSSNKDSNSTSSTNKILPPSAPKLPSSLSISITTSPTSSTHSHHKDTANSGNGNIVSRRTSDYSINSIMSTSTTSAKSISPVHSNFPIPGPGNSNNNIQSKSADNLQKLPEMTIEPVAKKSKSDIAIGNSHSSNNKKDGGVSGMNLNIRSVTKINSMVDTHDDESSESSDGVEIIGVFPSTNKKIIANDVKLLKSKEITNIISHQKNKHENYQSQKSSTSNSTHNQHLKQSSSIKTESPLTYQNHNDNDLDVLQIMKDLKELQEMQQTKN